MKFQSWRFAPHSLGPLNRNQRAFFVGDIMNKIQKSNDDGLMFSDEDPILEIGTLAVGAWAAFYTTSHMVQLQKKIPVFNKLPPNAQKLVPTWLSVASYIMLKNHSSKHLQNSLKAMMCANFALLLQEIKKN